MKNLIKLFLSSFIVLIAWFYSIMLLKKVGLTHIQVLYVALIYLGLTVFSFLPATILSALMSKLESKEKFNYRKALEDDGK
ncbi:hypothetical protein [Bacillus tequilensis]|uniref:hypothetical protein n=1 Tax=Bacillus tequilensis TaxID=227866 RepID=UPI000463E205|nr:hypothetical protein [Bacillus tequilensis]MDR4436116.1 hypothetical protein [Bacillus tequilensis]SPT93214.1 Uncharacterised protein [Bacillus tequilensis]